MVSEPLIWIEALFWPGGAAEVWKNAKNKKSGQERAAGYSLFMYIFFILTASAEENREEKY